KSYSGNALRQVSSICTMAGIASSKLVPKLTIINAFLLICLCSSRTVYGRCKYHHRIIGVHDVVAADLSAPAHRRLDHVVIRVIPAEKLPGFRDGLQRHRRHRDRYLLMKCSDDRQDLLKLPAAAADKYFIRHRQLLRPLRRVSLVHKKVIEGKLLTV